MLAQIAENCITKLLNFQMNLHLPWICVKIKTVKILKRSRQYSEGGKEYFEKVLTENQHQQREDNENIHYS